ncbi:MAG TPA: hypothetical protein EYF98_04940 [Planctomycetes bacterium]|nr:hypothetical protein [Planctomycetota bacterium]
MSNMRIERCKERYERYGRKGRPVSSREAAAMCKAMETRGQLRDDGSYNAKGRRAKDPATGRVLVYKATGKLVKVGDETTDFRGSPVTVSFIEAPHKPGSTGKVYVTEPGSDRENGYYPGVIGAEWRGFEALPGGRRASVGFDNLGKFKRAYKKARKSGDETFVFDGQEILVAYAKYLIEHMENEKKRRGGRNPLISRVAPAGQHMSHQGRRGVHHISGEDNAIFLETTITKDAFGGIHLIHQAVVNDREVGPDVVDTGLNEMALLLALNSLLKSPARGHLHDASRTSDSLLRELLEEDYAFAGDHEGFLAALTEEAPAGEKIIGAIIVSTRAKQAPNGRHAISFLGAASIGKMENPTVVLEEVFAILGKAPPKRKKKRRLRKPKGQKRKK